MKSIDSILNTIATAIATAAEDVPGMDDYHVVVCPERIFINDYVEAGREDLQRYNRSPEEGVHDPLDMPRQKTVYIVVKFGQGQINKAVLQLPVTIQCLSESDEFTASNSLLRAFCNRYNFEYTDGMVMSFFTPEISSSADEVYSGYRSLMSCRGSVTVAEDGLVFVTEVWCKNTTAGRWFRIPFLSMQDGWTASTDPQSFAGYDGRTMNLNRQSTTNEHFECYLWSYTDEQIDAAEDEAEKSVDSSEYSSDSDYEAAVATARNAVGEPMTDLNWFSKKVLNAKTDMNAKFYLYFKTNVIVSDGDENYDGDLYDEISGTDITGSGTKYYIPQAYGWFTLVSRNYSQRWGSISAYSLAFTESKRSE